MMISVICVYNNTAQFEGQLCKSLETQNANYELIGINNSDAAFSSASKALNHGAAMARGDVLVFSHQDIFLKTGDGLGDFANEILRLPIGTVVGTQGVKETSRIYYTNLTSGKDYDPEPVTDYEEKLYEVSCVDEGFFGMRRETWERHPFDETLCDNWHLYCVEQCLWNRKNGGKVYVYPTQLHHFSNGTISKAYMDNLKRLCKVYRKDFRYIWTTCYKVRTNPAYINGLVFVWKMNRLIRGKLK